MEEPKEERAQVAEDYRDLGHWWRASHLESFEDVLREALGPMGHVCVTCKNQIIRKQCCASCFHVQNND